MKTRIDSFESKRKWRLPFRKNALESLETNQDGVSVLTTSELSEITDL